MRFSTFIAWRAPAGRASFRASWGAVPSCAALVLGALAALPALPARANTPVAPAAAAPGALEWVGTYDEAVSRARKEKKLVLIDFMTDWCGWCKRLDKDVFADASFQKAASGVLAVKINAEKVPQLAQRYQVNSFPRLFFLNSEGTTVERIRGYLSLADFTNKVAQVKRGDTEFARFRDAANDPRNIGAVEQFARMLSDDNQNDQAIPYWQQVHDAALDLIFKNPGQQGALNLHREALLELGDAYAAVGLPDVARQQYEEVLRTYPDSPEAQSSVQGLARMHAANASLKMPTDVLEQVVRQQPGTPIASVAQMFLDQLKSGAPR
jgi:thioredoxin-related protein